MSGGDPRSHGSTRLGPGGAQPAGRSITTGPSWRALLLGLALTVPNVFWITTVEVRWYALDGTSLPLFITPIFFLFCLAALNVALRRRFPRFAFTQAELITVYIVLVMGTLLSAHDMFQNMFGSIGDPYRNASPENHWKSLFLPLLPQFWMVRSKAALRAFYVGSVNPYDPRYFGPFLKPLFWWALFIAVLVGMCLCINILIRTRWTEHERLSFPIVQLPTALTAEPADRTAAGLLGSKVMWFGFAIAAGVDLLNGLHYLFPSLPYIAWIKLYDIGQYFPSPPWNALAGTNISLYPFAIGLAYFVPLDLLFSCWFFFVARELFQVYGAAAGLKGPGDNGFPYFAQQSSGAWLAWGVTIMWALRGQFQRAWAQAFRNAPAESGEPGLRRQYRAAFLGLAAGTLALALYSRAMGLRPWVALLFFALYFVIALTITRARAELGTPHEIEFVNPRQILVTLFGSQAIGARSLTDLSAMYWFNRGYRAHPMPNQLEAMKLAESARMRQNSVIWIIVIALLWGALVVFWANLHVTFVYGGDSKCLGFKGFVGNEAYYGLQGWLQTPSPVRPTQLFYMAGGCLMVVFLSVMRSNFIWWPFHPAGYALAVSYAMDYFWFCFFVAWILKSLIVRYGGMGLYNRAIPFFMGLILGDYVCGSLWSLYGAIFHMSTYKIFL